MFKTPRFWSKRNLSSLPISLVLFPFSIVYYIGFLFKKFTSKTHKISKPVICVGNLIAGGSGKTPTAIALGKILHDMSVSFAYLSRGYMNDGSKFLLLRKGEKYKSEQVGDEPLLLVATATTFVAKNRIFGARQIDSMRKFDAVVLDDGMQCNSLYRDYTILVVDGKVGFGNGFMLPAGPMREPLLLGLKKADLVVVVGEPEEKLLSKLKGKKIVKAHIFPKNLEEFFGKKLFAFCGLAYPEKFFSYLNSKGLDVTKTKSFPDHYNYKIEELEGLCKMAEEKKLTLITTRKDWVKFPKQFQDKISYLGVELEFEDVELIKSELRKVL